MDSYFREYHFLEEGAQEAMSYNDYYNLSIKNKPRLGWNQQNFNLLCKLEKMTIPYFDRFDRYIV